MSYALSTPIASVDAADGRSHFFFRDELTMKLEPVDDLPLGDVVAEFRVDGDGWHHYYGWPDAPAGTPFRFTPRGTNIKELIYGSLSAEGLSPQPWERREPGWGTHTHRVSRHRRCREYRAGAQLSCNSHAETAMHDDDRW